MWVTWYCSAPEPGVYDQFGGSAGINGNQEDNRQKLSGAVYSFEHQRGPDLGLPATS
jgi:hypothetical protein